MPDNNMYVSSNHFPFNEYPFKELKVQYRNTPIYNSFTKSKDYPDGKYGSLTVMVDPDALQYLKNYTWNQGDDRVIYTNDKLPNGTIYTIQLVPLLVSISELLKGKITDKQHNDFTFYNLIKGNIYEWRNRNRMDCRSINLFRNSELEEINEAIEAQRQQEQEVIIPEGVLDSEKIDLYQLIINL